MFGVFGNFGHDCTLTGGQSWLGQIILCLVGQNWVELGAVRLGWDKVGYIRLV